MTAVMSAYRVDSGSFSSPCCTFRRTHTSADPIRLLCIRLASPLTPSSPSGLDSSTAKDLRLVSPPGPYGLLLGIFLLRKKICPGGVLGTRTDRVLKGEGSAMTTQLLQYSMLHGLMVDTRSSGLDEEVTRRVGRGDLCLSDSPLYLLRQAASN